MVSLWQEVNQFLWLIHRLSAGITLDDIRGT